MSVYREAEAFIIGLPADVLKIHSLIKKAELACPSEEFSHQILPRVGGYAVIVYRCGKTRVTPQLDVVLRAYDPVVNALDVCVCLHAWAEIGEADAMTFQRGNLLIEAANVFDALEVFKQRCADYHADLTKDELLSQKIEAVLERRSATEVGFSR